MAYSGTSEVERILGVYRGKITIGTALTDNLGTSDIRLTIDDADDLIDAQLSDTIDTLPVSPTPEALKFASKYYAAYLIHTSLYSANKPGKPSDAVETWKELAEKAVEAYKKNWQKASKEARWTETTVIFKERGVDGVVYQGADGVVDDDDILDKG